MSAAPFFMPPAPRNISTRPHLGLTRVEKFISGCPDRYFVTLTSKRQLDQLTFEAEVAKTMHRVNSALFGTAYRRGQKMFLGTMATQERTFYDGLHTHMLVGVPDGALALKANPCPIRVPELIVQTWISGDPKFRRAQGQDAQEVYDFDGVRRYICKGLKTLADFDNVDLRNTIIPSL